MAAIKFKNALGVERHQEEGFGGIDRTAELKNGSSCQYAENLDVAPDCSLSTRAGYELKHRLGGELRAVFYSADKIYALAGKEFICIDTETDELLKLAEIETETGEGDIFCYNGEIYLHDGKTLYRYDGTVLGEVDGYAPVYGRNWHQIDRGAIEEYPNLISKKIRLTFITSSNLAGFNVGLKIASIDRVEINGTERELSEASMSIDPDDPTKINSMLFSAGVAVAFWLTLADDALQKYSIARRTKGFVFGGDGGERLCLYNPDISGHLLCSRPITQEAHESSKRGNPNALPLYIPETSAVCVGSGAYPITGMAQHYDRALLFTGSDTWCVDWEGDEANAERISPKIFLLNSAIGSDGTNGVAYYDNDPLTYYCGGLWRWHSQSGSRDECSATLISDQVADLLPKESEYISMLSIPQRERLYIADTDDERGRVLVYNTSGKTFTVYSEIYADKLLRYGNDLAFVRDRELYVLSSALSSDFESDEVISLKSTVISHFLDFSCPERKKRSVEMILRADLAGGGATVTFENELGEKRSFTLNGKSGGGKEDFVHRFALPRFRRLHYTLESTGTVKYCGIILSAK